MPVALPKNPMKVLILLTLAALTPIHAAESAKCESPCTNASAAASASEPSRGSSRLLRPRNQAARVDLRYSAEPLRPAPGMTAWKPKPRKVELATELPRKPVERPAMIIKVPVETAAATVDEKQLMEETRPRAIEASAALPLPAL